MTIKTARYKVPTTRRLFSTKWIVFPDSLFTWNINVACNHTRNKGWMYIK